MDTLCYRILDVPLNASPEQIRKAYLLLVNVWHPDRFSHDADVRRQAQEKLKHINDAFARIKEAPLLESSAVASSSPTNPQREWPRILAALRDFATFETVLTLGVVLSILPVAALLYPVYVIYRAARLGFRGLVALATPALRPLDREVSMNTLPRCLRGPVVVLTVAGLLLGAFGLFLLYVVYLSALESVRAAVRNNWATTYAVSALICAVTGTLHSAIDAIEKRRLATRRP